MVAVFSVPTERTYTRVRVYVIKAFRFVLARNAAAVVEVRVASLFQTFGHEAGYTVAVESVNDDGSICADTEQHIEHTTRATQTSGETFERAPVLDSVHAPPF